MRRREFIATFGGTAAASLLRPLALHAQTSAKRPLVAMLAVSSRAAFERNRSVFLQGIAELGGTEGRDFGFVERYADGVLERLPAFVDELVGLKPDVIL